MTRHDAHRHLGGLPDFPFYGGPPINPAPGAPHDVASLLADLDANGVERCLVIPNYGVPDPEVAFRNNALVLDACAKDDRVSGALWVSTLPADVQRTAEALTLVDEPGVKALKISYLLGGAPDDEACQPGIDTVFAAAKEHDLVVHVHTSPGAASDVDKVGTLVDRFGDDVKIHLVHFGGGMSGHMKLGAGRFFDWVEAGKKVYTDLSWAIGFAPRWFAAECERRGVGADRVLFASDEPWGDFPGEAARLEAAFGDGELGRLAFHDTFTALYGS